MSRASAICSASGGRPFRPRRVLMAPSCICPPAARCGSEGKTITGTAGPGRPLAYCSASSIRRALRRACWSSVKATAPAMRWSCSSASCSPFRPLVRAPSGSRRTAWPRERCIIRSMPARPSITGTVLGSTATAVKPPRAAASSPLVMPCFHSSPGSRKWARRSTHPGLACRASYLISVASPLAMRSPMRLTTPSRTRMSTTESWWGPPGSTTFTCFRSTSFIGGIGSIGPRRAGRSARTG